MKYLYLYLISILLFFSASNKVFSQEQDSMRIVKGYVMDGETLADLSGVHIFNSRGYVTVSDIKGFFRIRVLPDDTLTFSRIDYERKSLLVTNIPTTNFVVTLKQKVYILDTVDITSGYTVPSYLLKPEKKPVYIDGITRYVDPSQQKDYHMGVGEAIASPATAIYQMFSKRYKEEKKVYKLEQQQSVEEDLREKVYARIEEILELNDVKLFPEQYDHLIEYCKLNLEWVASSNNYDLYLRMKDCLQSFLKEEQK